LITKKWFPVDMYIGGKEHSVLHLLYVRFVAFAFHDWKMIPFSEPFKKFRSHGLVTKDGAKMSKSKGNVVNPDDYIAAYGADAMRMYLAFMAPLDQGGDFRDAGIVGITRFLERTQCLVEEYNVPINDLLKINYKFHREKIVKIIHKTIKKVTEDIENLQYNTAIAALMILLNEFEEQQGTVNDKYIVKKEDIRIFLKLLAPFAPHIVEELWQTHGFSQSKKFASIHREPWPMYQKKFLREKSQEFVVQINGKVRDTFMADVDITEKEAIELTRKREKVMMFLAGREPKKVIFVPGKLINIVI
ncbi:MAG: class I tRNA ligase family protein, partial [Patescibacteria group bacterium]